MPTLQEIQSELRDAPDVGVGGGVSAQQNGRRGTYLQFNAPGVTSEQYTGWKFHLSVDPADRQKAQDILLQMAQEGKLGVYKVVAPGHTNIITAAEQMRQIEGAELLAAKFDPAAGKTFTLYDTGQTPEQWRETLEEIEKRFNESGVRPSVDVLTDKPVQGSRFSHYRYDGNTADGKLVDSGSAMNLPRDQRWNPNGEPDRFGQLSVDVPIPKKVDADIEFISNLGGEDGKLSVTRLEGGSYRIELPPLNMRDPASIELSERIQNRLSENGIRLDLDRMLSNPTNSPTFVVPRENISDAILDMAPAEIRAQLGSTSKPQATAPAPALEVVTHHGEGALGWLRRLPVPGWIGALLGPAIVISQGGSAAEAAQVAAEQAPGVTAVEAIAEGRPTEAALRLAEESVVGTIITQPLRGVLANIGMNVDPSLMDQLSPEQKKCVNYYMQLPTKVSDDMTAEQKILVQDKADIEMSKAMLNMNVSVGGTDASSLQKRAQLAEEISLKEQKFLEHYAGYAEKGKLPLIPEIAPHQSSDQSIAGDLSTPAISASKTQSASIIRV